MVCISCQLHPTRIKHLKISKGQSETEDGTQCNGQWNKDKKAEDGTQCNGQWNKDKKDKLKNNVQNTIHKD